MDACMEVDGRVGERRGNIYISKRISTLAGYTLLSVIMLHDLCVIVCVCLEVSAFFHIISVFSMALSYQLTNGASKKC